MPDPLVELPPVEPAPGLRGRFDSLPDNVRGGLLFLLAASFSSVMVALIKLAGQRLPVAEILFFRQITMGSIALPVILSGWPDSMRSRRQGLQLVRILVAFGSMTLGFSAVIHLPLAEATVIGFSRSFFITLLAILLLGETVGIPRWTGVGVGFAGVLIVVWPENGATFGIWHMVALSGSLCTSTVFVIIRMLSRVDRPVTIMGYQAIGVGLLMAGPMIWFWKTPTPEEWALLIGIGAVSATSQYINILAMRAGEASALAPLTYTRLIFVTLLGLVMFNEWPTLRVLIGAVVIIGAALFVLYRERRAAQRTRHAHNHSV